MGERRTPWLYVAFRRVLPGKAFFRPKFALGCLVVCCGVGGGGAALVVSPSTFLDPRTKP
jgi:hypothetical protein